MAGPPQPDLKQVASRLKECLERQLDVAPVEIEDVSIPAGGHSGFMFRFVARWEDAEGSQRRELIARTEPDPAASLFLGQDVMLDWRMMDAVGRGSGVPVPPLLLKEPDATVLGGPFYVMGWVEGRVPADDPSYHTHGFVAQELTEPERAELWFNGIDVLARLHTLDYRDGFRFLERPERGARGLDQYLSWLQDWWAWVRDDRAYPIVDAAIDFLVSHKPEETQDCVLWGDSRIGNMIFSADNTVAAVIDWEMAALGPGEADLGWWLVFDDLLSRGLGIPRLAGLPGRDETVARYEQTRGCAVRDLRYYEVLAALRFAIILIRASTFMRAAGLVGDDTTFGTNSHPTRFLAEYLGLPVPELSPDILRVVRPDLVDDPLASR